MKVLCDREKLREGLAVANNVIPSKSTKPVLENVCLVATDDALELVGTDLERRGALPDRGRQGRGARDGGRPGARDARLRARPLGRDGHASTTSDGNCAIASGDGRAASSSTVDPDEFPVVSRFGDGGRLLDPGRRRSRAWSTARRSPRRAKPGRYAMHGVLTEIEDGMLQHGRDRRPAARASRRAPIDARARALRSRRSSRPRACSSSAA